MTTSTFALAVPAGEWTLVAAGATYAKFGVQLASVAACEIAIAASSGAIASGAFVVLSDWGDKSLSLEIDTGDNVYARGTGDGARLRGYRGTV